MTRRRTKSDIVRTDTVSGHVVHYYRQQIKTGDVLEVPTFVVRNDALKGWQIRISRKLTGYHSEFVSDGGCGDSPGRSLAVAIRKLYSALRKLDAQRMSGLRVTENPRKRIKLGVPGATVRWLLNKKRGIYELRISLRAGGGERRSARFMKMLYVGTEMSVTEERIRNKLHDVAGFRRRWVADHTSIYDEVPRKSRGRRKGIHVDVAAIEGELAEAKKRHASTIEQIVSRRVEDALSGPGVLQSWRGISLKRKSIQLDGQVISIPWFVDVEGDCWVYTFPLPDGSVLGDALPMSSDWKADMREILLECMLESARTNRSIPRDSLW